MDALLSFLSDLILLTAGLFVVVFWLLVIMVISVESFDMISVKVFGKKPKNPTFLGSDEDA